MQICHFIHFNKEFGYVTIINFPQILKDNHLLITAPTKKYYLESY